MKDRTSGFLIVEPTDKRIVAFFHDDNRGYIHCYDERPYIFVHIECDEGIVPQYQYPDGRKWDGTGRVVTFAEAVGGANPPHHVRFLKERIINHQVSDKTILLTKIVEEDL